LQLVQSQAAVSNAWWGREPSHMLAPLQLLNRLPRVIDSSTTSAGTAAHWLHMPNVLMPEKPFRAFKHWACAPWEDAQGMM